MSHFDLGACPECLIKACGKDWENLVGKYENYLRPKDGNGNTYTDFITDKHDHDVSCWGVYSGNGGKYSCNKIWNVITKEWEVAK